MKLLQCKIENFGKISDETFDFTEGANVICQENGWGKSTLAAFLRILFFGFENPNKQDKFLNERKRFMPWQGGVYGGSVTFEAGGREYVMRRVFGKKEKDDEFELREVSTNLPSDDFSSNVGEELFAIDRASFMRTVFISQQDCETSSTDGINAKLGNLVENTDDINNFQSVYDQLKDRTNKMIPTRKTGSLNKEKAVIAEMENDLREEETITRSIREVEELRKRQVDIRKRLDGEIHMWQEKQSEVSENLDLSVKRKEYAALQATRDEAGKNLTVCQQSFPDVGHIPAPEQVAQWQELARQCDQYHDRMLENQLSREEMQSYENIRELLKGQVPTEENMEELEQAQKEYDKLKLRLVAGRLTPAEEQEWERLAERYPQEMPTEEETQRIRDVWDETQRRKENITSKKATREMLMKMQAAQGKSSYLPAVVLLAAALAAGPALAVLVHPAVGLALSAVLLATAVLLFVKNSRKGKEAEQDPALRQLEQEIAEDERAVQQGTERIRVFLQRYTISCPEEEIREQLGVLLTDAGRYRALAARKESAGEEEQASRYEILKKSLSDFMMLYYEEEIPEEQWASRLSALKEQVRNFCRWQPKTEAYTAAMQKYQEISRVLKEDLAAYGLDTEGDLSLLLQDVREQVNRYVQAKEALDRAADQIKRFEAENNPEKLQAKEEPEEENTLTELHSRLEQCQKERDSVRKEIAEYDDQLQGLQEQLDDLMSLKIELAQRQETYREGKKKYDLLLKTMELLQRAKDNLTARYMGPVQTGFEKYFRMISGATPVGYQFDASANLTVDELGMSREVRFLSDGCRDLVGICTRMALIDAMYEGEKPFVILDDPFVNLDHGKTEKALEFLREISKEYQVLYFTCHESRV